MLYWPYWSGKQSVHRFRTKNFFRSNQQSGVPKYRKLDMEITRQMKMRLASNIASIESMKLAGFSASSLRSAGFSASDVLSAGFSASDVLSAGFSASSLRSAGFSASSLRSAGFSASDVLSAGFSASDVLELEELEKKIPLIDNPYSKMWADIKEGQRSHNQSTFGPDCDAVTNVCGTAMCTAGHLVQMGGIEGWALRQEFGFAPAAAMIHAKAHPGWPCQDFGMIKQEWALAYIEEMADWEKNGAPAEFQQVAEPA